MNRTIIAAAALAVALTWPVAGQTVELPSVCNKTWVSAVFRAGSLSPHPQFKVLRKAEIVRAHYAPGLKALYIVLRRQISGTDSWLVEGDGEIIKFLRCLATE